MTDGTLLDLSTQIASLSNVEEAANLGENLIDLASDEGVLKEIPFVQWIASAVKIYKTVQDRIFFKKVCRFVKGIGNISESEKMEFVSKLESDPKFKEEVSDNIICILSGINNMYKPFFIGKVFSAYIKGYISYEEWVSLGEIISILPYHKLQEFESYAKDPVNNLIDIEEYSRFGISKIIKEIEVDTMVGGSSGEIKFINTKIGDVFARILDNTIEQYHKSKIFQQKQMGQFLK
jgi:hypothetical protein